MDWWVYLIFGLLSLFIVVQFMAHSYRQGLKDGQKETELMLLEGQRLLEKKRKEYKRYKETKNV